MRRRGAARAAEAGIAAALLAWPALAASAGRVAIFISKDSAAYAEPARAIKKLLPEGEAEIRIFSREAARAASPEVIVAVGAEAASGTAAASPGTPLVYLAVVYPERLGLAGRKRTYGVAWLPHPKAMARAMRLLLPGAKRLGMISSREEAGSADLREAGLELVLERVQDEKRIPKGLRSLSGRIDAFWMGVDPVWARQSAYDILASYASQSRIPLLVPFDLPGRDGTALAGITASPEAAAGQASRLVRELLAGREPGSALVFPEEVRLTIDLGTARSLGVAVPREAVLAASKVYE